MKRLLVSLLLLVTLNMTANAQGCNLWFFDDSTIKTMDCPILEYRCTWYLTFADAHVVSFTDTGLGQCGFDRECASRYLLTHRVPPQFQVTIYSSINAYSATIISSWRDGVAITQTTNCPSNSLFPTRLRVLEAQGPSHTGYNNLYYCA